jgi:short-subunit dehydrogenase
MRAVAHNKDPGMSETEIKIPFGLKLAVGAAFVSTVIYTVRLAARHRRRVDFTGKTVLISGASRGLGLELARGFAGEGANLILVARDDGNLAQSVKELRGCGVNVESHSIDIGDRHQVREALASILAEGRNIDVLINNAGSIQVGPVENMELDDYEAALRVHFWGPLYLMHEIIPHMKARGQGRIVNIASIGGKVAVPHLVPYTASKFALAGLSQGMRAELLKDGIYVTTVSPGLMRTGSHLNAYFKGQHKKEYALFSIANASPLLSISSEEAARQIIEACRYGRAELVITAPARMLRLANSLFPGFVSETMGLVNRALPKTPGRTGDTLRRGSESQSPIAPSVLTRPADKAAQQNNEIPSSRHGPENGLDAPTKDRSRSSCECRHVTHFLGRCQIEVKPPERTCAACMENHFHRVDDPAI